MLLRVLSLLACLVCVAGARRRPHILFFLVDDMGFNDFSWRDPRMHTPNLQRLRDNGVELNQMYMLPKCTASRAALMSARYPYKMGVQSNTVFRHCKNNTLPLNVKTMGQYLKDQGYATHAVGKWHLGFCKMDCTPTHRGFDSFYGSYMGSIDNYKLTFSKADGGFDFHFNEVPHWPSQGHYSTALLTQRTQAIIHNHADSSAKNPLFIYVAYTAVHDPIQSPSHYIHKTKCQQMKDGLRRKYCGMLAAVDESIGNITSTIAALGASDDFLIYFSSDNGGAWAHGASNWPLRGHKGSIYEGGTRVAAFMHGPSFLPKSPYAYDGLLHAVDLIPTLVAAGGGSVPDKDGLDGLNAWSALQTNGASPRTELVYNIDTEGLIGGLRQRNATDSSDFKLVYNEFEIKEEGECAGWQGEPPGQPKRPFSVPCKDYMLFDLKRDPEEKYDVAAIYPQVMDRLMARYNSLRTAGEVLMPQWATFRDTCKPYVNGGAWTHGWC